jgi:hypothetical protein
MRRHRITGYLMLSTGVAVAGGWSQPAMAIEPGAAPQSTPGATIGATAKPLDPGIYFSDKALVYQAIQVGAGAARLNGNAAPVTRVLDAVTVTAVPGWNFLGATYSASITQKFAGKRTGQPTNTSANGVGNTFLSPIQLAWNVGNGFYVQANAGVYIPDGTTSGPTGLANVGAPYYTFQPQVLVSYIKDGWAFTANLYDEINTKNTVTNATTGQIFHADFTATKTIGRFSFGPVAYFTEQITSDKPSAVTEFLNQGRFANFAVGGLLAYDFGPVKLSTWATDEVYAKGFGGNPGAGRNTTTQGFAAFAQVSFKVYPFQDDAFGPAEHVAPQRPMIYK